MEKDEFREVLSVYREYGDTLKNIEVTLEKMLVSSETSAINIQELNKHFRNGFKNEIIDKVVWNFNETAFTCRANYSKEFTLLFYKLLASSTLLITILSLIVYIVSKGKIKLPF